LSPHVLFCKDIDAVIRAFPGSGKHVIGTAPLSPESAKRILKNCAPLATRNWCIYIERVDSDRLRYGVLNYLKLPTALPLAQAISVLNGVFCILLQKISPTMIRISGSNGNALSIVFSTVREEGSPTDSVKQFANCCCVHIENSGGKLGFSDYLAQLLDEALAASHGTILVCATLEKFSAIPDLKIGTPVEPKLDLADRFATYRESNTADSILKLQSCEELLKGFVACDGIVVFDTQGGVLAYRAFYRPSAPATPAEEGVVGGARTKAFTGIRELAGSSLVSALLRSQDGFTDCVGS